MGCPGHVLERSLGGNIENVGKHFVLAKKIPDPITKLQLSSGRLSPERGFLAHSCLRCPGGRLLEAAAGCTPHLCFSPIILLPKGSRPLTGVLS